MKTCAQCRLSNPEQANFCMNCGAPLSQDQPQDDSQEYLGKTAGNANWNLFWLTLGGSLVLTWLMVMVFHLPIFILGALVPLVWFSRKK